MVTASVTFLPAGTDARQQVLDGLAPAAELSRGRGDFVSTVGVPVWRIVLTAELRVPLLSCQGSDPDGDLLFADVTVVRPKLRRAYLRTNRS